MSDPPPLKWSASRYGFEPEEDRDGEQEAPAGGGLGQAAAGGCPGFAGAAGGGGDPGHRRDGGHLLSLAARVRGPEVGPGEAAERAGGGERAAAQGDRRPHAGQADPGGGRAGKLLGPARRRACIEHVQRTLSVSERRACAALGQPRSTQRQAPRGREDEERLTADTIELARQYGRYGYRKVAALLRDAGWLVNAKRVERIWRREGLKVPPRQPKRGRLW